MTLPVGTQAAAASILCSAKPVAPPPPNVIPNTDQFVRKIARVWTYQIVDVGQGSVPLKVWQIDALFYSADSSSVFPFGTQVPSTVGESVTSRTDTGTTESLLYYVNPEGTFAQVYPLNAVGNPLSTSCWTSLGNRVLLG